ncbi:hypothetical protein Pst134EA_026949 [Puccinia striiformis f. sp. tritici]|uniref:hypothetical protein n=1 Tax=Puccinia striiformis f. sp. tritici TaxID=168172 RepID=UPI0020076719|nr:hypothetical protein Pst134EA_026949 [Puccinia striiformis f. sp. tritici]KAH9450241.1 hypothetical protein Pst134EA_026949 [Puccinia striiformis f. sp. tritici]
MLRVLHSSDYPYHLKTSSPVEIPDRNLNFDTPPPHFEYLRSKSNQRNHIPPLRSSPLDSTGPSSLTTIGTPHLLIFLPSIPRIKLPREPTINKPSRTNLELTLDKKNINSKPWFPYYVRDSPFVYTINNSTSDPSRKHQANRRHLHSQSSLNSDSNRKTNLSTRYFSIDLREYQAHKKLIKMEEVKEPYRIAKWLLSELKKNRTNGAKEESQYLAFVQLYGDYKEELAKARKLVNTPAPETNLGTTTPKKIEKVPVKNSKPLPLFKELEHGTKSNYPIAHSSAKKAKPTVPPNLEPTGNVLLDAHIAKKAANELKAIVPLDISDTSTIESTDSLFTTKPFELTDLFPKSLKEKISAALSSTPKAVATPISTKATPISKLLVVDDSDNEGMDNHPHSTPDLTTLNQEERERVEKKISPLPSLSFKKKNQEAVVLPSAETTPEPLLEEEEEVPNKELIRTLVNKHVKIYRTYLTTSLKEDQKTLLDRAQESQKVLHKLIGNPAVEAYTKGWNPWDEKKKLFPAPPKIKNKGKKRPRIQPSTDQLFSLPPQLQTPQGTQHRSQGSREVETTRSSDDNTQTHASPHVVNHVPQRWYVTLQIPK